MEAGKARGFTTEDVLWSLGIWSVILSLSPVIVFYVLMVAYKAHCPGRCAASNEDAHIENKEKRAGNRAFLQSQKKRRCYAACLCIAPLVGAEPRIAFTERSIAAHSRAISAAARPSA